MLRTLIVLVVVVVLVVGGYVAYVYYSTGGEPVKVEQVRLIVDPERVTEQVTPVKVEATIYNGFHLGIEIVGGSLEVYFNGVKAASVELPPQPISHGYNKLTANVEIENDALRDLIYSHLSQGEKSVIEVKGVATVSLGPITRDVSINVKRDLETNAFPADVEIEKEYSVPGGKIVVEKLYLDLAEVTRDYIVVEAELTVLNDTVVPIYVGDLAYSVEHVESGVKLAEGRITERTLIAPGESDAIPFTVKIDLGSVKPVWVAHIKSMEESTVEINLWVSVDVAGEIIDLSKETPITIERKIKTSIFEYEAETGGQQG